MEASKASDSQQRSTTLLLYEQRGTAAHRHAPASRLGGDRAAGVFGAYPGLLTTHHAPLSKHIIRPAFVRMITLHLLYEIERGVSYPYP